MLEHWTGVVNHIAIKQTLFSRKCVVGRTTVLQVQGGSSFEWLWLALVLCAGVNGVLYVSKFRKDRRESKQEGVWNCLQILSLRGNPIGRFVKQWQCNMMNSRSNDNDFHPGDMSVEFSKPIMSCGKHVVYCMLVVLTVVTISLPTLGYVLLQR